MRKYLTELKTLLKRSLKTSLFIKDSIISNDEYSQYKDNIDKQQEYLQQIKKTDETAKRNKEDVIKKINELTNEDKNNNLKTGVIATEETKDYYYADLVKSAGHKDKENEVAHHLFRILREFDEENIQKMYSESFKSDGVGAAVMNRLLKAAGHQIIKV